MSRLDRLPASLRTALAEKRALKVIAGLTNFDAASVERISRAAGLGGADLIDVACDAELVQLAASVSGLPICVSAVDPELFPAAVAAGVSGLFMETHPDPESALSDGPNSWPLDKMGQLLETLLDLDRVVKRKGFVENEL